MKLLIGGIAALALGACGGDDDDGRSNHGYAVFRTMSSDATLYLSGAFREPELTLGHQMLIALDASDPSTPAFASETDLLLTQAIGVLDGQLIGAQAGFDETMLPNPPQQNVRVKMYDLADPLAPAEGTMIEIPDTFARNITGSLVLDETHVLITVGDGSEDGSAPLTWVIDLAAPDVTGIANVACRAGVRDGDTIWCFNALGQGSGFVVGLTLGGDGSLTELTRADVLPLIDPVAAAISTDGAVVVADDNAGVFAMARDVDDVPSSPSVPPGDAPGGKGAVADDGGNVIVQTALALQLVDPVSLAELSATGLGFTDLVSDHIGGSDVTRLIGGPLDGLYAASFGDHGVLLVRDEGTLVNVGGYYRDYGTTNDTRFTLGEGNY